MPMTTAVPIMEKDEQDDLIEQACVYLTEKAYPDGCTQSRKRQIRKKAEKFQMLDGELYYAPKGKQVRIVVLLLLSVSRQQQAVINNRGLFS